jgi:hypothetical protein
MFCCCDWTDEDVVEAREETPQQWTAHGMKEEQRNVSQSTGAKKVVWRGARCRLHQVNMFEIPCIAQRILEKGKTATRRPWALQRGAVGPRTLSNTTQGGAWSRAVVVGARTRAGTGVRVTLTCLQLYFLRVQSACPHVFFSARGGVPNDGVDSI